ncbi:MAG: LysM peptidoglycan-binding domain-containing protein [Acidimicrobiales bacterium]
MQANRALSFAMVAIAALVAVAIQVQLASADSYKVRDGDTLWNIAERLGVSIQDLAEANGITDPNLIVTGQMLVVPSDGGSAIEYVVRDGDTLMWVSEALGVPVADLARANGIEDPNLIISGHLLSVPPVATSTGTPVVSAAVVAPSPVTAAAGVGWGSYTVRSGDVLSDVALKLGVPLGQLVAANNISDPNVITVGQVISAPNVWNCPVPAATFVNDYGYVKPDGVKHLGVDMFAPRGTPIVAPVSGAVEIYPNNAGGKAVRLYGNDGNRYYFAHMDDYGESGTVSAGEIIGYVGNTGDAVTTSPHLHFEIRPGGGDHISPYPTLVAACR